MFANPEADALAGSELRRPTVLQRLFRPRLPRG
jgi:hypothetical protein